MISLYDILEAANGQLFGEPGAQIFSDFCFDSRFAAESNLYVALKNDWGDGHQYMYEAVQRGATGVLCTRPPEFDTEGLSVILVKDTNSALMKWSYYTLNKLGPQVIGVTGTSGKSVTVEAITHVLQTRYGVQKSIGDTNGRLSLPMTLAKLTSDHKIVVLELGAAQPGEMSEMVLSVQPQVGVITRIGADDRSDTADQLAQEDSLLIEYLPTTGLAVLNYDDDRSRALASRTRAKALTVGLEGFGADFTAYNLVLGATGTGFDVRYGQNRHVGRWSPLLGNHQLYAILSALAVGTHYDIAPADALKALTNLMPLPGRMNPLNGVDGALLIDDSFSADPQSALAALDWLHKITDDKHRAIFMFGDMDNLGEYNQRGHRIIGQRAADAVDLFVTIGTDAALAGRAALDQGMDARKVRITYSIQDAVAQLKDQNALSSDDIVLIKGGPSARTELLTRALLANDADAALLPRVNQFNDGDQLLRPIRPSWVDIDLDALANNVRGLKSIIGDKVMLIAVVKANAYGHGAISVARTALLNGAEYLAVASMQEAVELRSAGIEAPILVMSYTPAQAIRQAVRQNITITLYDLDLAHAYDRAAREAGGTLRVHVKVDTGMGRLGVMASDAMVFFRQILGLSHLEFEGIYTHFSMADEDLSYTLEQVKTFKQILTPLRAAGFNFKYIHAANSAGTLVSKETHFNAVRTGLAMYGLSPSELAAVPSDFRPVLSWKTVVAQVKTLPPGHPVGYGGTYYAKDTERIAVIPVGYSDGLRRSPQYWGHVLVKGQFAPIIGRVSMEKTTINVTDIPDVSIGDEVVLIGRQGSQQITADEIARRLGTISYEVLCSVVPRAPRR
ncbi:MAG TPA: alanine racemase [Phototrophicaceae bacterium]|nr:alanine racemase [Phototrophicaceae bacterium]